MALTLSFGHLLDAMRFLLNVVELTVGLIFDLLQNGGPLPAIVAVIEAGVHSKLCAIAHIANRFHCARSPSKQWCAHEAKQFDGQQNRFKTVCIFSTGGESTRVHLSKFCDTRFVPKPIRP